jgi:hypothetical protein
LENSGDNEPYGDNNEIKPLGGTVATAVGDGDTVAVAVAVGVDATVGSVVAAAVDVAVGVGFTTINVACAVDVGVGDTVAI